MAGADFWGEGKDGILGVLQTPPPTLGQGVSRGADSVPACKPHCKSSASPRDTSLEAAPKKKKPPKKKILAMGLPRHVVCLFVGGGLSFVAVALSCFGPCGGEVGWILGILKTNRLFGRSEKLKMCDQLFSLTSRQKRFRLQKGFRTSSTGLGQVRHHLSD